MDSWTGIAVAARGVGDDAMVSRLPTYSHPLAGRGLAWHVLRAMRALEPSPRQLFLAAGPGIDPGVVAGLPAEVLSSSEPGGDWWAPVADRLDPGIDRVLLADAAAPVLSRTLVALVAGAPGRVVKDEDGQLVAAWLDAAALREWGGGRDALDCGLATARPIPAADPAETLVVRDRAGLARASALIRERLVRRHMEAGVTFLAPETVLIDVDVTIARDTVVYPGVVLEGNTHIGSETVVGPACRIVDSRIGSGVELKGWNYITRATIRNRYVLEPYVRRGFD